jgi:hypothetical protein
MDADAGASRQTANMPRKGRCVGKSERGATAYFSGF